MKKLFIGLCLVGILISVISPVYAVCGNQYDYYKPPVNYPIPARNYVPTNYNPQLGYYPPANYYPQPYAYLPASYYNSNNKLLNVLRALPF